MDVDGSRLKSIVESDDGDSITIIDQTRLPHNLELKVLSSLGAVIEAIINMRVRGAPLIGVTAAYGLFFATKREPSIDNLIKARRLLLETRPTAVNLQYAVDRMVKNAQESSDERLIETLRQEAGEILQFELNNACNIGLHGVSIIQDLSNKKGGETVNTVTQSRR